MEGEFIDVGLPICTSKSWHPGGFINHWWNHRITLMNVHTYHQHTACAGCSFTDVSVLRQTGNRASTVGSEKVVVELSLAKRLHVALTLHPHPSFSREHLWSVWVTFLLSYKSRPAFSQWRQFCYSTSHCMLFSSLVNSPLNLWIRLKWKSAHSKATHTKYVSSGIRRSTCLTFLNRIQKAVQTVCPSPFLLSLNTSRDTVVLRRV